MKKRKVPYTADDEEIFKSNREVFIGIAMSNYDNLLNHKKNDYFRVIELTISTFVYAYCALEAFISDIHHFFFVQKDKMKPEDVTKWRKNPLENRLKCLLGEKAISRRRKNLPKEMAEKTLSRREKLLKEMSELRNSTIHPEPIVRFKRKKVLEHEENSNGSIYRMVKTKLDTVDVAREHYLKTKYKTTKLPPDPTEMNLTNLKTVLLVLLEFIILLERKYSYKPPGNLYFRIFRKNSKNQVISVSEWFDELRKDYDGPHGAYFKKLRILNLGNSN